MNDPYHDAPEGLRGTMRRLETSREELSSLELDRVKRRAMTRKSRTTSPTQGTTMRSRLAIILALALGLLMTGSGAALGISAITSTDSASVAQYGSGDRLPDSEVPDDEVLGDVGSGGDGDDVAADSPGGRPSQPTQPARQIVQNPQAASLPFTGLAAIPLLVTGLALLTTGLILRRRSS